MVKTAWHHGSIAEHTHLITQAIAKATLTMILSLQSRPVKFISRLKPELICKGTAAAAFTSGLRKILCQNIIYPLIQRVETIIVPQPQYA